ncbi:MAG TPA: DNA-processing protein DprA [Gemmataceae bacterium]|jgi:DNA processing protein
MADGLSPELRDLLALNLVPNLGPRLTAALLRHFGSAGAVRRATAAELRRVPLIGPKLSEQFAAALASVGLERECESISRHGVRLIALGTAEYPPALAEIPGPPHLLYVRGTLTPADHRAVAVVGSRGCTGYGRRVTEGLAAGLVHAGFSVVSGLARGVDGVAHAAALKAGGRTVAVLAGGLSRVYPPEHADLAAQVQAAGALVSEAPMDAEPLPAMFPPRNRIISGLSQAVVVVEASERSGTLITARHAAEQGREVFAVPGPVDSPASAGCHLLIRQGATLVRSVDDILEALATGLSPGAPAAKSERPAAQAPPPDLDGPARRVWDFLADGPRHVDAMAQTLALGVPELTRTLMVLEMRKAIRRLPGNQYERR